MKVGGAAKKNAFLTAKASRTTGMFDRYTQHFRLKWQESDRNETLNCPGLAALNWQHLNSFFGHEIRPPSFLREARHAHALLVATEARHSNEPFLKFILGFSRKFAHRFSHQIGDHVSEFHRTQFQYLFVLIIYYNFYSNFYYNFFKLIITWTSCLQYVSMSSR